MDNNYKRVKERPDEINDNSYRFDSFDNSKVLLNKKKNHLPAMGWNSWNAFGSGNTEALTKDMADCIVKLGLDKLGYKYIVLDDGCYKPERVKGKLSNEEMKFPSGFKALGEYIHNKGLKFGMYNDIGTNLCAGALVGTCGYEDIDAKNYIEWGIDFIKVDNCYYLWDNATFSDSTNAKYVYAPNIKSIEICGINACDSATNDNYNSFEEFRISLSASKDGKLVGRGARVVDDYVTSIGTFDGTGPDETPVGVLSSELVFDVDVPKAGEYLVKVLYATGKEEGVGSWLQLATGEKDTLNVVYDDFLDDTASEESFVWSKDIKLQLTKGLNKLRFMNHRRQENTLKSYATFLEELNKADESHDIIYSICEWGKTQPQNWGYKVGDSWRILNDITFQVGADGDYGVGEWSSDYTPGIATQYNKCVIMDEFAGLDRGWNDPDMLMIGMNGVSEVMAKTHMTMWCMMNSPLMLGLDLRRVEKNDYIYNIIANEDLISLNQDALGIQCKRVYSSLAKDDPSKEYIRDNNRIDIIAKPLSDGGIAVSFINLSDVEKKNDISVSIRDIVRKLAGKCNEPDSILNAKEYKIKDLWTKECFVQDSDIIKVSVIPAYDNITYKISPMA